MSGLGTDRVVGAAAWRFAYLGVQGGLSLLLFVAIAHALPARAFAETSLALGVLVVAQALGDFGLSQAAVTALPSRIAAARERAEDLLAGASVTFFVAAAAALALALLSTAVVPGSVRVPVALIAIAAALSVLVAGADGLLRSVGEFRRPVLLVSASRLGSFAGLPVAFLTRSAAATCAAISLGTLVGSLPAIGVLLTNLRGGRRDSALAFARAALPLGISYLFIVVGGRLNTVLLGAFTSVAAAAAFEGAWRLYQLGQYAIGSLATAIAPFAADAFGSDRHEDVRRLLRRTLAVVLACGVAFTAVALLLRHPLAHALFPGLADQAARALVPFALVTPLALAGLVAVYTLGAVEGDRRQLPWAFGAGAAVNVALLPFLVRKGGAVGAAEACASGLVVTNAFLFVRLSLLMRRLRFFDTDGDPLVADTTGARPGPAKSR